MSTRATIALHRKWHLYNEFMDCHWNVWLQFPKEALEATEYGFALRIPLETWKALREHTSHLERYLDCPIMN